jgi:hypothetical protein
VEDGLAVLRQAARSVRHQALTLNMGKANEPRDQFHKKTRRSFCSKYC